MTTQNLPKSSKTNKRSFFKRIQEKKHEGESVKETKTHKSPSIYRRFSEKIAFIRKNRTFYLWRLLFGILFVLLFLGIVVTSISLYGNLQKEKEVAREHEHIVSQVHFWEGIVQKYKGYRDGYFQLALLEYQLGDKAKAKQYLDQVFLLDPNFEDGRKLEKLL